MGKFLSPKESRFYFMKIENKAPERNELVLTTKKHVVYVTLCPDGKTRVQIVGRKRGSHQHHILGEPDGIQTTTRDPRDSDPNHG